MRWYSCSSRKRKRNTGQLCAVLAVLSLLASCRTRYVTQEVPVMVHDSIKVTSIVEHRDTLWRYDTEVIVDTMYIDTTTIATLGMPMLVKERGRYNTSERGRSSASQSVDTVYVEKEKPVFVKHTEVKEVNKMYWWQTVLIWIGASLLAILFLLLIYKLKKILCFKTK